LVIEMAGLNKVQCIGNLGRDPEIRRTQSGDGVANFSVAVTETWKDKQTGERREKTEWINIVVFGDGLVRVVEQYLKKGSRCYVEGKIQTRKWQDKDGRDRYTTEVVVQGFGGQILLLDSKDSGGSSRPAPEQDAYGSHRRAPATQQPPASPRDSMDDAIPF
jgi:single-strand DNA-binding protein